VSVPAPYPSTVAALGVVDVEAATSEVSVASGAAVIAIAVPDNVNEVPIEEVTVLLNVPEPVTVTVTASAAVLSTRK
jgi:hypothetical protein